MIGPVELRIASAANGIALAGRFARAKGLAVAAEQPELRFVQLHGGHPLVLEDGTLRGEGFARWQRLLREGGAETHVTLAITAETARFQVTEAWLDRLQAIPAADGSIRVARLELACDAIRAVAGTAA